MPVHLPFNMFRLALLAHLLWASESAQDVFLKKDIQKKPHILLILADDLGHGNVGWTRKEGGQPTPEVQTPTLDKLVAEGVELSRFYAYHMCSPSRSSLISGRLPMHVNMVNEQPTVYNADSQTGAGIPRNMSGIAAKLKSAGYKTHMAGKWDAGMATPTHTPHGRGFDTALCYFHHDNSYWTELVGDGNAGDRNCPVNGVDLFDTLAPAYGLNGSQSIDYNHSYNIEAYSDYIFVERLVKVVENHDADSPLFMYFAPHSVHEPYEIPQQYLDSFSKAGGGPFDNSTAEDTMRMTYHAMAKFLDDAIANLTGALKSKGMWENTLVLFASDNGGPIYAGGNNYPLRGGKYSEFEGGVRVVAFASGGYLPTSVQGTKHSGLACLADIYTTVCSLADVDSHDAPAERAGLPPVDGLDLSKMLLHKHPSPRTEVPLAPMSWSDMNALDAYDHHTQKPGQCWTVQRCGFQDDNIRVEQNINQHECCALANSTAGCDAAVLEKAKGSSNGTCYLKVSAKQQVVSMINGSSTCFLPSSRWPRPIIKDQAGFISGDLKLITGTQVRFASWTGPQYPNASTHKKPNMSKTAFIEYKFDCTTPYKVGCVFNVTADPTEHSDLAEAMPELAEQLLNRLRIISKTRFDPKRGKGDPAACKQVEKNGGFYGPWLEMNAEAYYV